jgi:gluconolactonase
MNELTEITAGLEFPEGPIAMPDGTVVLVEMFGPRLTRVHPDGTTESIAELPGGPNGAAVGPGGLIFVCNNGARFGRVEREGLCYPGPCDTSRYLGGRIQTVDPATGAVADLYTECDGVPLWAPNDLVFDAHGGFYFTDHGFVDEHERVARLAAVYYAEADGSQIREVVYPAFDPNGIGLSPDGGTLYWAETRTGRIMRRRVVAPGELAPVVPRDPSGCLHGFPGLQLLDSLAVDTAGNVCVATLVNGGISVVSPDGELLEFVAVDDILTTNICFGGPERRTAYITASSTGRLLSMPWPRPGAALHHLDT